MLGVRRKKIAIAGAQGIALIVNRQFQRAADDPVRLILVMRVRAVDCSRRVAPFKDTVAFSLQTLAEGLGVRLAGVGPSLNTQAHFFVANLTARRLTIPADASTSISFPSSALLDPSSSS